MSMLEQWLIGLYVRAGIGLFPHEQNEAHSTPHASAVAPDTRLSPAVGWQVRVGFKLG